MLLNLQPLESVLRVHPWQGKEPRSRASWRQLIENSPQLPAHPRHERLGTACVVVGPCATWMRRQELFFLHKEPKTGRHCHSRAYVHVCKNQEGWLDNARSFSLTRLLCHMYRGPAPASGGGRVVAGHLCHNKLCVVPWHLAWMPHALNVQMGHDMKRKRDRKSVV